MMNGPRSMVGGRGKGDFRRESVKKRKHRGFYPFSSKTFGKSLVVKGDVLERRQNALIGWVASSDGAVLVVGMATLLGKVIHEEINGP